MQTGPRSRGLEGIPCIPARLLWCCTHFAEVLFVYFLSHSSDNKIANDAISRSTSRRQTKIASS